MQRANKVIKIIKSDDYKYRCDLEGHVVFEDNWIQKGVKNLVNQDGEEFKVLDHKETEEQIWDENYVMPFITYPENWPLDVINKIYSRQWKKVKRSCLKLDKTPNVGDCFCEKMFIYL